MKKVVILSLLAMVFASCEQIKSHLENKVNSNIAQYGPTSYKVERSTPRMAPIDTSKTDEVLLSRINKTWQIPLQVAPHLQEKPDQCYNSWPFYYPNLPDKNNMPQIASR